jgi:hypothetical protein
MAKKYQLKKPINAKTIANADLFDFQENKIKIDIVPSGDNKILLQELSKINGVKVIDVQKKLITCWVEMDKIKTCAAQAKSIVTMRPFIDPKRYFEAQKIKTESAQKKNIASSLAKQKAELDAKVQRIELSKNADTPTKFGVWEADSEAEEKNEKEASWWSKERDLYEYNLLVDPATNKIPRDAATLASSLICLASCLLARLANLAFRS